MTEPNNIIIYWNSGANNYQFYYNPEIYLTFRHLQKRNPLADDTTADYHMGWLPVISLMWKEPRFMNGDQLEQIRQMYATTSAVCIYPDPESDPTVHLLMKIVNDFDFPFVRGSTKFGYEGQMIFEGTCVYEDDIPPELILMQTP